MIVLPYPPSVNSAFGGGSGQKRFKSKKYKEWLASCPRLFHSEIKEKVKLTYSFYFPDNRIRDLGNLEKCVTDFLVSQRVLEDDNWHIVSEIRLVACGIDKNNPRVEIDITKVFPIG